MKDERGYTLIEIMVVLHIIAIIGTIVVASFKPMIRELQNERFISLLIEDLYYAQQLSLATNNLTQVLFFPNAHQYNLLNGSKLVYSRSYDKHIEVTNDGTLKTNELRFLSNGNVYKSGSIVIYIDGHPYFLRILLGKGRFYVEKA